MWELGWLGWLKPEYPEDAESEGVWYGLPIPNSRARSTEPVFSLAGRIRLFRGGGRLEVSGPMDGFRAGPNPEVCLVFRSFRVPGADGVRIGGSATKDGLGNVSERFRPPSGGGSNSSSGLGGGPKPS